MIYSETIENFARLKFLHGCEEDFNEHHNIKHRVMILLYHIMISDQAQRVDVYDRFEIIEVGIFYICIVRI